MNIQAVIWISASSGTHLTEEPFMEVASVETSAIPQYFYWIQSLFWVLAAGFALAALVRKRSWADALMCLGCCTFALHAVIFVIALVLPSSEVAMRIARSISQPMSYGQVVGAGMLACSAFLRWRGPR